VGTVAAAVNTHIGLSRIHPDILINAGTAGGFRRKGAEIGDVFITTNIRHHDRRIPIPGFEEFSRGHYSSTTTPNLISVCGHHLPSLISLSARNLDTNLGH
jgi:5'-methylthioadenosine nucleosidase